MTLMYSLFSFFFFLFLIIFLFFFFLYVFSITVFLNIFCFFNSYLIFPKSSLALLRDSLAHRQVGSTAANRHSSRSHCVLSVGVWKNEECTHFDLVDLAGSEKAKKAKTMYSNWNIRMILPFFSSFSSAFSFFFFFFFFFFASRNYKCQYYSKGESFNGFVFLEELNSVKQVKSTPLFLFLGDALKCFSEEVVVHFRAVIPLWLNYFQTFSWEEEKAQW